MTAFLDRVSIVFQSPRRNTPWKWATATVGNVKQTSLFCCEPPHHHSPARFASAGQGQNGIADAAVDDESTDKRQCFEMSASEIARLDLQIYATDRYVHCTLQHQCWLCKFPRFHVIFSRGGKHQRCFVELWAICPKGFVPTVSASNQDVRRSHVTLSQQLATF